MNKVRDRVALWSTILLLGLAWPALAHVGSPNVFFEGEAGPHPIRVVIRPPPVVPGLAQISVRVKNTGPHQVQVLPVKWDAGRKGAPPPDSATLVRGETNLYSAELWFMTTGAHGVLVRVESSAGKGEAIVPITALATRRLVMTPLMTGVLSGLGLLLVALLASIARAALSESLLEPGSLPTRRRLRGGRLAALAAMIFITGALYGGYRWWGAVDRHFVSNRLYRSPQTTLTLSERDGHRALRLAIDDPRWERHQRSPLIPDHGKLMHLFLVRQPGLDVFAHLHPSGRDDRLFNTALPPLPEGEYLTFADITHETGASQTLTGRVRIGPGASPASWHHSEISPDPTDAWHASHPVGTGAAPSPSVPSQPYQVRWEALSSVVAGVDLSLSFQVVDANGQPAPLELYMGMPGHAVILHEDSSVFTHLHPQGTASMASLMTFAKRELDINAVRRLDDLICGVDTQESRVHFPYAFPKPGRYRVWFQAKARGQIVTGAFEVTVAAPS